MTRKCHPFGNPFDFAQGYGYFRASSEAKPKDLVNEKSRYIGIHFAALRSE
ncbi:MAG: hypothetical protein ABIL62_12240 [Planctomycetota bacterium]